MTGGTSIAKPLAQALSAAAVVVSLVFVGLEVRESARQTALNTQSIQVSAYQNLIAQINTVNMMGIENPEARRQLRGALGAIPPDQLSAEDQAGHAPFYFMLLRHGDLAFYQYELGMLSEERLESALSILVFAICTPGFQEFWTGIDNRFVFVSEYRDFIEERIAAC